MDYKTNVGLAGFLRSERDVKYSHECEGGAPTSSPDIETRHWRPQYDSARRLADEAERAGRDIVRYVRDHAPDLLGEPENRLATAAESIVQTCKCYGISVGIDSEGTLVVGKAGGPAAWLSLRMAIEAHLEAVGELVASGWQTNVAFSEGLSGVSRATK